MSGSPLPRGIRAVFFDYGGTLDADGVPWKELFYPIYVRHGVSLTRDDFYRAFYTSDDSLTEEGLDGMSLFETVQEQVRRVLGQLGIDDSGLNRRISSDFCAAATGVIDRNKPALETLARKYSLGVISNNYGNLAAICEDVGLGPFFRVVVDSRQVGFTKPDPRIFRCALDALRVSPAEAVMVGDSEARDVQGALGAGLFPVLLAPEHVKSGIEGARAYPVISKLETLVELLAAAGE